MSLADDFLNATAGISFEYSGLILPSGFLWEDGKAYSRTTFQRLFEKITLACTGNITSGSTSITGLSVDLTQLDHSPVGWPLSGPGISAGTTVTAFTSSSITISAAATASTTGGAIILAPWGVGDGVNTFNVPDSRGRVIAGRDNMGGTAASRITAGGSSINAAMLGAAGGAQTHTLDATQIPAHSHPIAAAGAGTGAGANTQYYQGNNVGTSNTGTNAGGGGAHNNTQPTLIKNKIIKY